jgi:hypothetical protein
MNIDYGHVVAFPVKVLRLTSDVAIWELIAGSSGLHSRKPSEKTITKQWLQPLLEFFSQNYTRVASRP